MFRRIVSSFRAEPLKNTGSLARDLLASERTFLSWSRTGLGLIGLGVALEKVEAFAAISPTLLRLESGKTKVAAGVLVASGSFFIAHGTARYYSTLRDLKQGLFRPNLPGINLFATTSIGIALAGTLLVLENEGTKEKVKVSLDGNGAG